MKSRFAAVAFAAMMLNGSVAFAEVDMTSANHLLRYCQLWNAGAEKYQIRQGVCFGVVAGVAAIAPNVCAPEGVTSGQIFRVAMRFIEQRPARHHEKLAWLALEAMQSTWPCKK